MIVCSVQVKSFNLLGLCLNHHIEICFFQNWSFIRFMRSCYVRRHLKKKKIPCHPSCRCSVTQWCLTLCNPMDCSTPGFPFHHQLPEPAQTHVHWVGDAIQPSHPPSSPSPPALNLSQHQGLFKWVSSLHQVARVLEFQLQYQYF